MPNRMIREGITTSEPLSFVSFEAETLFYRLLVTADDFGAFDGRPVIVRAKCMPLRDVTSAQIETWLRELAEHALIVLYVVENRPYGIIPKFKQRTRAAASKFPLPVDWQSSDGPLTDKGQTSAHGDGDGDGDVIVDGDEGGAAPPARLPLNDGTEHALTGAQVREFADLYPAVDVPAELRKMRGWLIANPANRKTQSGVLRFVTRWLGQEQDKARIAKASPQQSRPVAGNSPDVKETPQTKLAAERAFCRQQIDLGHMTTDQAKARVSALATKLGIAA